MAYLNEGVGYKRKAYVSLRIDEKPVFRLLKVLLPNDFRLMKSYGILQTVVLEGPFSNLILIREPVTKYI
ncbi:hypothetical protein FHK02_6040 [Spirosoma sp. LMG 31448]|uniref:Uncharacterized protein n=1 Tax=Spirosoma utsteinense TaxID=2585773 RepID=A0ABR6WF65_9BACT|nr:hypothetical protein [Spirosoma utsteinense]MBC3795196.1 hypothetical protein [Spirosoma utsteinense]